MGANATLRTLFIGGLPPETDDGTLQGLLAAFKGITRLRLIQRPSGRFGYATFETEEAARRALHDLDGIEVGDARLRVAPAV